MLGLVFSDTGKCHGEHDDERQRTEELHLVESEDVVVLEPEADVEPAVDPFDSGAFVVFALPRF